MRKLLGFVVLGASLAAAAIACVDDEKSPASTNTTPAGQLGGPCLASNECNAGLTCALVGGKAQCVGPDGGTGASSGTTTSSSGSTSGSLTDAEAPKDSGSDSGPNACTFTPQKFPCGGDKPPTACYGATQDCALTGCPGGNGDLRWSCNGPAECNGAIACCVAKANATLTAGQECTPGILQITTTSATGSECGVAAACPTDDVQLCAKNSDCPSGKQCKPVKITNGGAAFTGQTLGACAP